MDVVMFWAGVCVIIAGMLQLFNRDMAWRSRKWANDLKGVKSERTEAWERSSIVESIFVIIGGFVLLALSPQMGGSRSNAPDGNSRNSYTGLPNYTGPGPNPRYFDKDGNEIFVFDKTTRGR